MLDTFPDARIATVPVPLKFTHARQPYAVATDPYPELKPKVLPVALPLTLVANVARVAKVARVALVAALALVAELALVAKVAFVADEAKVALVADEAKVALVAEEAAPLKVAVIVPALKLPEASRATTLLAVLVVVASTANVRAVDPLNVPPLVIYVPAVRAAAVAPSATSTRCT